MFLGEIAALATAVCWSLTAVFFSTSGRIAGSAVVNRSRLLFAFLFLAITHLVLQGTIFPFGAEPFRWFWLAISSILGLVLGDTFLFQAYLLIGPRLSMLLTSTVPIFGAFLGWLLFGETISPLEMAAVLLTVSGVAWVVTEKQQELTAGQHKNYKLGLFFGLLGAFGQVANLVTARYGLVGDFPAISATLIRILVAIVIMWGSAILRRQVGHTFRQWRNRKAFLTMLAGAFSGPFLGIWLSLVAIQFTRLGIAATLMALPPILLIPVDFFVYKKTVSLRGIAGTIVAFIGVSLIFLPQG